jgi:hypothetical protein
MDEKRTPLTRRERRRHAWAVWLSLAALCAGAIALVTTLLVMFPGR